MENMHTSQKWQFKVSLPYTHNEKHHSLSASSIDYAEQSTPMHFSSIQQ
jgi:hypothetical protein